MRKIIVFLLSGMLILFILSSCPGPEPEPEPEPEFEGVPGPIFNIPESLTTQPGKVTRAEAPHGVFSPFRWGLWFIDQCIDVVQAIIEGINEYSIPDNGEFVNDGELIVISTDTNREFHTMIEVYTSDTAIPENKYLQISYTKGINKGETVFSYDIKNTVNLLDIDMVKIAYDGTQAEPVLEGWLTRLDGSASSIIPFYIVSVYFTAVKDNDLVTVEGGTAGHYYFDADASGNDPYEDDHVYMNRAIADVTEEKAIVGLYFPQKDIALTALDDWQISDSFLYILFTWLNLPGNAALLADLETLNGASIDTEEDLYNFLVAYSSEPAVADLLFILDLDNPIAYNATDGYVANGGDVTSDYTGLGDISGVSFSEEPIDVFNLTISF